MSDQGGDKSQKVAGGDIKAEDDDIIDAEVVHEEAHTDTDAKTQAEPSPTESVMKTVKNAPLKKAGKGGWIAAGLLAAFMGGVYSSPYFEAGLITLGLRSAPSLTAPSGAEDTFDAAPLKAEIANLKAAAARHQEILAQQQDALKADQASLTQLREDIALLAGVQNPAGAITGGAELAALKTEITRLSDDLARLSTLNNEADPAVSQMKGALALARAETAQLKERLKAIEASLRLVKAGALEASPRGRLVLSLSRMKDRAMAGLPFAADVTGLRADISKLPALDQQMMGKALAVLESAGAGIQPYAALVRDFDPSVAAAVRAGQKADGNFLTTLFTSRRTDAGAVGDDAVINKAERLLLARDVAGALDVLDSLKGAVREALAPWLEAAKTHVAVLQAFDQLTKAAAVAGGMDKASTSKVVGDDQ